MCSPVMKDKRVPWTVSTPHVLMGGMQLGAAVVTCCIERIVMLASWTG